MRRALGAVGFLINQHDLQDRAGQFLVYLRIHRPGVRGVFYEVWTSLPYLFRLELLTLLQVVGTVSAGYLDIQTLEGTGIYALLYLVTVHMLCMDCCLFTLLTFSY